MKKQIVLLAVAVSAIVVCEAAQSRTEAAFERVELWPEGKMPHADATRYRPFLDWRPAENPTSRAVVIVVPGGAYSNHSESAHRFEALWASDYFHAKGLNTAILMYRIPRPNGLPIYQVAWEDEQRAVRLVRSKAAEWGIDPEKIGMVGFSAGAHLTLLAATSSQTPAYGRVDELDDISAHLNFAVPIYPAYVLDDGKDDKNSNRGVGAELNPEFMFDAKTPPMFLQHGDGDAYSDIGSLKVAEKLHGMGVPVEMHIYAKEPHCFQRSGASNRTVNMARDMIWVWMGYMKFL